MSLRTLLIRATMMMVVMMAVATTLTFVSAVLAAPHTQESPQENIDEVVVTSATTFTLTVRIDEVTTVAIPVQVDWRAEGPTEGSTDAVTVMISPTVLQTGFFSVTVGSVEPSSGTLAITRSQPIEEIVPITETTTTTATTGATTVTTTTVPSTTTADTPTADEPIVEAPAVNGATTNTISNLRAGPGTEYDIVGSADAGTALDIIGQNSDGTWLALANGAWVAAFLVDNAPADLPIIEPATLPTPTPAAPNILVPTATPAP